jgi:hypothetical protein
MSDLTVIALIAAIVIAGYFVFLSADKWTHERGDALATGVLRGVPMSSKHRWLLLFQSWLPNALGVTLFSLFVTLALVAIARDADNRLVESLAYLCAMGFGFACAFWLVLGPSWFVYYLSQLRQAEAD